MCYGQVTERCSSASPDLTACSCWIFEVLEHLTRISGQPEVSFHMSGTEAIMCAARCCRFNTRRKLIVQFAGAYHGWWDGVQPGAGNERFTSDVLSMKARASSHVMSRHPTSCDATCASHRTSSR